MTKEAKMPISTTSAQGSSVGGCYRPLEFEARRSTLLELREGAKHSSSNTIPVMINFYLF
jgi:hypothetical protein